MIRQSWSQEPNVANTSHRRNVSSSLAAGHNITTSWVIQLVIWPAANEADALYRTVVQDCQLDIPRAVKQSTYSYLANDIRTKKVLIAPCRFSSGRKCSVTRVQSRFGHRCCAAAGPRTWNNLPASLSAKEVSCTQFRRPAENIHVSDGLRRIVTLIMASYKYSYLLTYLQTDGHLETAYSALASRGKNSNGLPRLLREPDSVTLSNTRLDTN